MRLKVSHLSAPGRLKKQKQKKLMAFTYRKTIQLTLTSFLFTKIQAG